MNEEVKWVQMDYPFDKYSVSNTGLIKNNKTQYIQNKKIDKCGYLYTGLQRSDKNYNSQKFLHCLVAEYFLDYNIEKQRDKNLVIHHIDSNRANANVNNLQIVSRKENSNLSLKLNRDNNFKRKILQYDLDGNFIAEYDSISSINIDNGNVYNVSAVARGKGKTYKGYIWRYAEDLDLDGEIWKQVEYNSTLLMASNKGRIIGKLGVKTFGSKKESGYYVASLADKRIPMHRIICLAFHPIDNPEDFVVNHIDHNKGNNCAENLEWLTVAENNKAYHKFNPDANKKLKNGTYRAVIRIDENGNEKEYTTAFDFGREYGGRAQTIACNIKRVCNGVGGNKTAYGYKWKWKDY